MSKIQELINAFKYIPKLFKLIYKTDKIYLFCMLCETFCFAIISYPSIFLLKYAVDAMERGENFNKFVFVCILLISAQFAVSILKSCFNSIRPGRTHLVVGILYNEFHKKSMEMDYELLAEKKTHELQALAGEFIKWRLSSTVWNFISLISSLFAFAISGLLLVNQNFFLITVIVAGLVLDSFCSFKFTSWAYVINKEIIEIERKIQYYDGLATSDNAAKDIRIFNMSDRLLDRTNTCIQKKIRLEHKKKVYSDLQKIISVLCVHGIDLFIYLVLGVWVLSGKNSIGTFIFIISNISLFRQYYNDIAQTMISYSDTAKYIEYYNEFMSLQSIFRKTGTEVVELTAEDDFDIEFRDVSFRYPGQEDFVLRHLNLTIRSGEKIAIIGENGEGKSTFVKLLMRLYDPTEGEIIVNGLNIKQYDYDQYLSLFAPIFQDYKLFAFTLEENISSFEERDLAQVQMAAEKVRLDERIRKLPQQYNTYITKSFSEDGVEFSGGEQQKIALARTYFKRDAMIVILDEPTSALDPYAEYMFYQDYNDLIGNNTAIFISHRLSSTKFCDKIVVIKDKKVNEFGTHEELMSEKGQYYSLYNMQASYFSGENTVQ